MSEEEEKYIMTGHRIFRGGMRIESELMPKDGKPFVIHQPGDVEAEEVKAEEDAENAAEGEHSNLFSDETIQAVHDAAEDIAARIAHDRTQMQADILAVARAKTEAAGDGAPEENAE